MSGPLRQRTFELVGGLSDTNKPSIAVLRCRVGFIRGLLAVFDNDGASGCRWKVDDRRKGAATGNGLGRYFDLRPNLTQYASIGRVTIAITSLRDESM